MRRWTVFFASVALVGAMGGCGDGSDSTTGHRIKLGTRLTTGPEATFTNSEGWSIVLSKAYVSVGPLYYFDGAVIFSSSAAARKSLWADLGELFEKRAYAHPGHYIPGEARGEMRTPLTVDLRVAESVLPSGEGVTGVVRSATFSFQAPPAGDLAPQLGGHVAVLEGTATKGADVRIFRAEIDAADVTNTENATAVEGCPFTEVEMGSDGTVTVNVKLALWLDQVEFDRIDASPDGTPVLLGGIARNELVRGMKAGDAYVFSYEAQTP
jgi:hypothetical protein